MLPYGTHIENIKNGGSKPPPYDLCSSADSGFGLLPDGAWTSTRYACPETNIALETNIGKEKWEFNLY